VAKHSPSLAQGEQLLAVQTSPAVVQSLAAMQLPGVQPLVRQTFPEPQLALSVQWMQVLLTQI